MDELLERKRSRSIPIAIFVICAIVFSFFIVKGFQKKRPMSYVVKHGKLAKKISGSGTLHPVTQNKIYASGEAVILSINVNEGDEVFPGTRLLQLSNESLEKRYADAQLALARDSYGVAERVDEREQALVRLEIQRDKAKLGRDRLVPELASLAELLQSGVIAKLEFVKKQAELDSFQKEMEKLDELVIKETRQIGQFKKNAEILLEKQNDALNVLKRQVEALQVSAGITGQVTSLDDYLTPGKVISRGQLLVTVSDNNKWLARLEIPAASASDVSVGDSASIEIDNKLFSGHLSKISQTAKNQLILVEVMLDKNSHVFRDDLRVFGAIRSASDNEFLYIEQSFEIIKIGSADVLLEEPSGNTQEKTILFDQVVDNKVIIRGNVSQGSRITLLR